MLLRWFSLVAMLVALCWAIRDPDQDTEETNDQKFTRSDGDGNGSLTFSEFLQSDKTYADLKREEFNQFDADKDGIVTRSEYENFYAKQNEAIIQQRAEYFGQLFEDFDENFDLKLDIIELTKLLRQRYLVKVRQNFPAHFARFDLDNDGGLNLQEMIAFDREIPFEDMDPIQLTNGRLDSSRTRGPIKIMKTEKLPMRGKNMP